MYKGNPDTDISHVLTRSKLRVEDLREAQQVLKEATWADDKEVVDCRQCQKQFSVSRRKVKLCIEIHLLQND